MKSDAATDFRVLFESRDVFHTIFLFYDCFNLVILLAHTGRGFRKAPPPSPDGRDPP